MATHRSGSETRGRYRAFDARLLWAISAGLDELDSAYHITEPRLGRELDYEVRCSKEDDHYKICGQASFDIIFGYAVPPEKGNSSWCGDLSLEAQNMLTTSMRGLGWDLERFTDSQLRPARNAMYGFATNHSTDDIPDSNEVAEVVHVAFNGPYSAQDEGDLTSIFDDKVTAGVGVYLWTIATDHGDQVWYVGQTRRGFGQRTAEHLSAILAGKNDILDSESMLAGEPTLAWRANTGDARWPQTLPRFVETLPTLQPKLRRLLQIVRFHIAILPPEKRLLDSVEGALGRHFLHYKPHDDSRRYYGSGNRVPARVKGARPIRLVLCSAAPIAGLPKELSE